LVISRTTATEKATKILDCVGEGTETTGRICARVGLKWTYGCRDRVADVELRVYCAGCWWWRINMSKGLEGGPRMSMNRWGWEV
jgi:hypothetical protein